MDGGFELASIPSGFQIQCSRTSSFLVTPRSERVQRAVAVQSQVIGVFFARVLINKP